MGALCDPFGSHHWVCQRLDCGEGISSALGNGHAGERMGSILPDNVQCLSNETTHGQCRQLGLPFHNCGHREDAGVICSGTRSWRSPEAAGAVNEQNEWKEAWVPLIPGGFWVILSLSQSAELHRA